MAKSGSSEVVKSRLLGFVTVERVFQIYGLPLFSSVWVCGNVSEVSLLLLFRVAVVVAVSVSPASWVGVCGLFLASVLGVLERFFFRFRPGKSLLVSSFKWWRHQRVVGFACLLLLIRFQACGLWAGAVSWRRLWRCWQSLSCRRFPCSALALFLLVLGSQSLSDLFSRRPSRDSGRLRSCGTESRFSVSAFGKFSSSLAVVSRFQRNLKASDVTPWFRSAAACFLTSCSSYGFFYSL